MSEEEGTSAGSPPTEQSVKAKRLRLSSYEAGDAIELSEKEREVFAFLLQVNDAFALGCTLRVAGGWVRDKVERYIHTRMLACACQCTDRARCGGEASWRTMLRH